MGKGKWGEENGEREWEREKERSASSAVDDNGARSAVGGDQMAQVFGVARVEDRVGRGGGDRDVGVADVFRLCTTTQLADAACYGVERRENAALKDGAQAGLSGRPSPRLCERGRRHDNVFAARRR